MTRKMYPKKMCNTCKHVRDVEEDECGRSMIVCWRDECEYDALVNAREILEALLDGQIVVDRSPEKREIYYRLNGNYIECKWLREWNVTYSIPGIFLGYSSIEGKKKIWGRRKGKKTHRGLKF